MTDLVDQPTAAPTRKLKAVVIAGLLTTAVIGVINTYLPGVGDALGPTLSGIITVAVSAVAGYFTRNAATNL